MRKSRIGLAAALLFCMLLSGCSQSSQVENHAYVLVMGMDRLEDGQIQMTVQIPKISGGSGESSGQGSGQENYTQLTVKAEDYEAALEALNWASPRDLNLSQIKLLVFSRKLAEETRFGEIIESIAQTERLYTAARVAICEGKAKDFVSAIQPNIGTRISTDINAMYEHYISSGYVPESSLADLFYLTKSVYSDPMVTYAMLSEEKQPSKQVQPASALSQPIAEVSDSYESDIPTRYLGAALFANGRLQGVLSGSQTMMANLLKNDVDAIRYSCDGQTLNVVPTRSVYVKVDTGGGRPKISINAKLSIAAQERRPNEDVLRSSLTTDMKNTIRAAQDMGVEPFGFAERAARNFLTLDDWLEYDWHEQFKNAEIDIKLSFAHSDA